LQKGDTRFLKEFRERLAKFGLELHPDKTRLIEFGRFAARNRKQRGEGKPETFTFLGFTHYCGQRHKSGPSPYGESPRKSEWLRNSKPSRLSFNAGCMVA
jgi:RNA-directed DNA polymerase